MPGLPSEELSSFLIWVFDDQLGRVKKSEFPYKIITKHGHGNFHPVRECHLPSTFNGEAYYTIANYGSEIKLHLNSNRSLSSYHGPVFHPYILTDLDRGKSSLNTLKKTLVEYVEFLEYEKEIPSSWIKMFFSGSKGFHLEIPSKIFGIKPEYKLETKIRELVDLLTADLSIRQYVDWHVYTPHRMIRLSNSIHPKSQKFKIPITIGDLRK